ncbi:hypothetical protein GIB67_006087 [Kingdonia uniflora]|uniref:Cytochrome P450 n=1 Tax=Kingdonia uniflora TaxID=39325 RepID=A0A7J7LPK0_9MAGN|nr:hypothetical protein GIB67_006087 [Kingdonia uniflora]
MEFSTVLWWFPFVCTSLLILVSIVREKLGTSLSKLPPGPVPLPIFGSLFKLGKKPHESLAKLAKTHGPLMSLKLGTLTTIVVTSSSMAKQVLQKHDQSFAGRTIPDCLRTEKNHHEFAMVWLQPYSQWRILRKISNSEIFHSSRLNANQDIRHKKVRELMEHVNEKCVSGGAVSIGEAAFVTVLNFLSNTMFSVDLGHLDSVSSQEFKAIVWGIMEEAGRPNLADFFPVLMHIDPQGVRRRMTNYFAKLDDIFDRIIDERLQSKETQTTPDVLDKLLEYSLESNPEIRRPHINALLKDIFVAGTDTTSSTLEWAMTELIRNHEIMEKARLELQQTIEKDKVVEESDIAQLPYLQAIVKETLRLHPPVPLLLPHRAETEVELCGFTVPKHTQVLVNAWAISRDPDTWERPTTFMPERFMGSDIEFKGQDFELIPFGAGRRICPGLPLAHRMVHLMLASLIHSYEWKLGNGMTPENLDMDDKFGITLQKAEPLQAFPTKI